MLILQLKWPVNGASGHLGADARVNVEDHRKGSGLVTSQLRVTEARTVMGSFSKLRREIVLNARMILTGILLLKVDLYVFIFFY